MLLNVVVDNDVRFPVFALNERIFIDLTSKNNKRVSMPELVYPP